MNDSISLPLDERASTSGSTGALDWAKLLRTPWALPAVLAGIGLLMSFWPLLRQLPDLWFADDSYYAHGAIIPFCAALIVSDRLDRIRVARTQGNLWALVPLAAILYIAWFTYPAGMYSLSSLLFVAAILATTWAVAGRRVTGLMIAPSLYLLFGLPVFARFIDKYTQPLQGLSASAAFKMLQAIGLHPVRTSDMMIYLDRFTLEVGAPCSGLKLLLAVSATVAFFALIAHLRFWANVLLILSAVPLTLAVNALRIMMVGVVGNTYGQEAGHQFHDYSGYIALVVCFALLMGWTKILGWKTR